MDPSNPTPSTPIVPPIDPNIGDVNEMDLDAITNAYDAIGQGINDMGQNAIADIAARQRELIGSDFSTPGEGPMGNYNESTYIEPAVTSGQSTIKQIGTQVALNEGIRRSEEAAEEKLKDTQKKYNEYVAEQNRKAAEAAAAAENGKGWSGGQLNENTVSQETLDKHGLSMEEFLTLGGDEKKKIAQEDFDRRAGYSWDYRGPMWYNTVDQLYKEFGVTGDAAKDERHGKTEANKRFWDRPEVQKRFGELHVEVNFGYEDGAQVMKARQEYVRKADEAVEMLLKPGNKEQNALSFQKMMESIEISIPQRLSLIHI